jgi:hypothetical protein
VEHPWASPTSDVDQLRSAPTARLARRERFMTTIWVTEESAVATWRRRLKRYHDDWPPTGDALHLYLQDACSSFDGPITKIQIAPGATVSDLIFGYSGERPRCYARNEFEAALNGRNSEDGEVLVEAERLSAQRPSLGFVRPAHDGWVFESSTPVWSGTPEEARLQDGDVLLLRRTSLDSIVEAAVKRYLHRFIRASMIHVRSANDFYDFARFVPRDPEMAGDRDCLDGGTRPRVVLLYTDEDVHVASYIRTHYDNLDELSGESCNVYFIENPSAVDPFRFWRALLTEKLYVVWKILGWAEHVPYDKAQAYALARQLGVPYDALPCACIFSPTRRWDTPEIVPLHSNLTKIFRQLFERFRPSDTPAPVINAPKATCFLSHSSADKQVVRQVAVALQSLGIETWFDEWQMRAGDSVVGRIQEGLASASSIVLFFSSRSLESPWLKAELEAALHEQILTRKYDAIIPVMLDACELPILLRNYRQIEFGSDALRIAEEIRRTLQRTEPL